MEITLIDRGLAKSFAGPTDLPLQALSETALQLGRQSVLSDMGLFSAWLDAQEDVREPSAYFGEISTPCLLRDVLLNPVATPEQCKAAGELLRARYLESEAECVLDEAMKASRA